MRTIRLHYPHLTEKLEGNKLAIRDDLQLDRLKVLRVGRNPYEFLFVDGSGASCPADFLKMEKDGALFVLKKQVEVSTEPPTKTLFLPIVRQSNLELAVKFASQLCVFSEISLYTADFSQVKAYEISPKKIDRLRKYALNSILQSGNLFLPKVELYDSLSAAVESKNNSAGDSQRFLLADAEGDSLSTENIKDALTVYNPQSLIIGPEGGFSDNEYKLFEKIDTKKIALGSTIMTTELAVAAFSSLLSIS